MKSLVRFGLVALCAIVVSWTSSLAAGTLEVSSKVFDAGKVQIGEVIEHEFTLTNTGTSPIKVTDVNPSCGCTVPEYPSEIQPGESGKIKLLIKTEKLQSGKQAKTATVLTTAANMQRLVLSMKMNLYTPLEFLPKPLVYMRAPLGEEKSDSILARPHRDGMKVVDATVDNEHIEVSVKPAEATKGEIAGPALLPRQGDYWITIKLKPTAPAGIHRGQVTVRTTDPEFPSGTIRISAHVADQRASN